MVDFFVAYTNRAEQKPRELGFVFNTLGELSHGMDNVIGCADYVASINETGGCAVPLYFFTSSTNLMEAPDGLVQHVNRVGYLTVSLHGKPVKEYAARLAKFDIHVVKEGTDVIPKRPVNLFARYREILGQFNLASMRPVREAPMTHGGLLTLDRGDSPSLSERLRRCPTRSLRTFLPRLAFNDTLLNALKLLDAGAKLRCRCAAGIFSLQVTPEMEFYPCMFTQYPDLRMGDIERGIDPAGFSVSSRAGAPARNRNAPAARSCPSAAAAAWTGRARISQQRLLQPHGVSLPARAGQGREGVSRTRQRTPAGLGRHARAPRSCKREWRPESKGE